MDDVRDKYECVSYVWGESGKQRRIQVDGHSFLVTVNLFEALQHFRDEHAERVLWVGLSGKSCVDPLLTSV